MGVLVAIERVRYAEVNVMLLRLLSAEGRGFRSGHNCGVSRTPCGRGRRVARLPLLMYDSWSGGCPHRAVLAAKDTDYFSHELYGATALAHRFNSPSTRTPADMCSCDTCVPKLSRPKVQRTLQTLIVP